MQSGGQRGWRTLVDGESRPTSRGLAPVEALGAAARSSLIVDFGSSCVKAAVAYHDRDRIGHLHAAPAYLLQEMFGEPGEHVTADGAARVLDRVCHQAASVRAGLRPTSLWLTHPDWPDGSGVRVLAQAARLVGFDDPTHIPEPLAAAACFDGLGAGVGEYVGVLDLGHSRFDATLLQRTADGHAPVAAWSPTERPSAITIAERLCEVVVDTLDDAQRRQMQGDDALRLAIRGELLREPLSWGHITPQQRRLDLPAPLDGTFDLTRSEFIRALSPAVAATVDGLLDAARQDGVRARDIAVVYLAGGLGASDLVGALIAERLGQVPICIAAGNEVALGAANACLGEPARPFRHPDPGRERVPRLYSPRRLMPMVCIDEFDAPCPDVVILDSSGFTATREDGTWHTGLRFSHCVIADMYPVKDDAERFALMDEAAQALGQPPEEG